MPKRVLIAEDNWLTPTVLRAELERRGYEVVGVARTGTEAVEATRTEAPDIVLMDIQMPEMDGLQATRSVMEARPTCVVIVTGRSELASAAERSGAMGYLVKPFMPDEVISVIEDAERRYRWFRRVLEESPGPCEAVQSWPQILRALQAIGDRNRLSETEAYAALTRRAERDHRTLCEAAGAALAEAEAHAQP